MHDPTKLSQGEIADKITILELKAMHGAPVAEELAALREYYRGPTSTLRQLSTVNSDAWDFVDIIHKHFDGEVVVPDAVIIAACRKAHLLNRERVGLKNRINVECGDAEEFKTWRKQG